MQLGLVHQPCVPLITWAWRLQRQGQRSRYSQWHRANRCPGGRSARIEVSLLFLISRIGRQERGPSRPIHLSSTCHELHQPFQVPGTLRVSPYSDPREFSRHETKVTRCLIKLLRCRTTSVGNRTRAWDVENSFRLRRTARGVT